MGEREEGGKVWEGGSSEVREGGSEVWEGGSSEVREGGSEVWEGGSSEVREGGSDVWEGGSSAAACEARRQRVTRLGHIVAVAYASGTAALSPGCPSGVADSPTRRRPASGDAAVALHTPVAFSN